jgi:hypothetical protein
MFGPKRKEVEGGWRRLHNEELHNLFALAYFIRAIKSRRMWWAVHVTRIEEVRNAYKGGDHSEDLGVDGKKILEKILGKLGGRVCSS